LEPPEHRREGKDWLATLLEWEELKVKDGIELDLEQRFVIFSMAMRWYNTPRWPSAKRALS